MFASKSLASLLAALLFFVSAATASAGPESTVHYVVGGVVPAHASRFHTLQLYTGEFAYVMVSPDKAADLDVVVRDPKGKIVDVDEDKAHDAVVFFKTKTSGKHTIEVRGNGVTTSYTIEAGTARTWQGEIVPRGTQTHVATLRADETTTIMLVSPDADLDLYVWDDQPKLQKSHTVSGTHPSILEFKPPRKGQYQLQIHNTSHSTATYLLIAF
jgi:hypothetical protein